MTTTSPAALAHGGRGTEFQATRTGQSHPLAVVLHLGREQIAGLDESGHPGAVGVLEDLLRRARLEDLPPLNDSHPIRHRQHLGEVVTDVDGRGLGTLLQLFQLAAEYITGSFVHGADRFVQHEDSRPDGQRPGQGHSLFLAAGEFSRIAIGQLGHAELIHKPVDLFPDHRPGYTAPFQAETNIAADGFVRKQGIILRQVSDGAAAWFQVRDVDPVDFDPPRVDPVQPAETLDQQRFSRARGPQQHEVFARGNVQGNVAKGEGADGEVELLNADHRWPSPTIRTATRATVASTSIKMATANATSIRPTDCSR